MGPYNQAYLYDTLPVAISEEKLCPGDLIFVQGKYKDKTKSSPKHGIVHVEIFLGGESGRSSLGAKQKYIYSKFDSPSDRRMLMRSSDMLCDHIAYPHHCFFGQAHASLSLMYPPPHGKHTRLAAGARDKNGAVDIFSDFMFTSPIYDVVGYHFRSIDTWMGGVCKSFCPAHR